MNGLMDDRQMDGQTQAESNGRSYGSTDRQMDDHMGEQTSRW